MGGESWESVIRVKVDLTTGSVIDIRMLRHVSIIKYWLIVARLQVGLVLLRQLRPGHCRYSFRSVSSVGCCQRESVG